MQTKHTLQGRQRAAGLIRRLAVVCLIGLLAGGCGSSRLRYQDAELSAFRQRPTAQELIFQTAKGRQAAYYLAPVADPAAVPSPLIVCFPGIGSRALDWLPIIEAVQEPAAGYLLMDYPGRGQCEGFMRPKHLPDSFAGALDALARATGHEVSALTTDLLVLGHSFGTAAGLMFAQDHQVRRVILLAPMNTLRRAMVRRMGLLAWLNPDNLDNREMLQQLLRRNPVPFIALIHGTDDHSLPIEMARELQALAPERIVLHEIPGGSHVSILEDCRPLIYSLLIHPLPVEE